MERIIWIDDREPDKIPAMFRKRSELEVREERQFTGDIVRKDLNAGIERKTLTDFSKSLTGRLWRQLDQMRAFDYGCVIVTGDSVSSYSKGRSNADIMKQILGTCAYINERTRYSAYWVGIGGEHGDALLVEYANSWFGQVERAIEKEQQIPDGEGVT